MLWEIVSREHSWSDVPQNWLIFQKIKEGERPRLPPSPDCPQWLTDLIRECWAPDPNLRPGFTDIFTRLSAQLVLLQGSAGTPPVVPDPEQLPPAPAPAPPSHKPV